MVVLTCASRGELLDHVLVFAEPPELALLMISCRAIATAALNDRLWEQLLVKRCPSLGRMPEPRTVLREVVLANLPPEPPDLVLCVEARLDGRVIFAGRVHLPEPEAGITALLPNSDNPLAVENALSVESPFFADLFDHTIYVDIGIDLAINMEMLLLDRRTGCVVKLKGELLGALLFQFHFDLLPPLFHSDELVVSVVLDLPEEEQLIYNANAKCQGFARGEDSW